MAQTTFSYTVRYSPDSSTATIGGDDTIEAAAAKAARDIAYVNEIGGTPWVESASAYCATCYGRGTVVAKSRRMFATTRCPACRGRNSEQNVLPAFLVALAAVAA